MKKTEEKRITKKKKQLVGNEKTMRGITLVALVVTIVVLLILAGITITYVMGDNSVFKQAQNAKLQTEIAKAREQLEVTFGHAKLLKHTDNKYNQDDYLDDLMEKEISNIEINDDIVVVDGYAFDIDRSEPKIGEYRGERKDLEFPEVTITTPVISGDAKTATFTINASERTKGISKIEIWLSGEKIDTITYETPKEETTENYSVNRNGVYKVKAYADLVGSAKVTVEGLIPAVEFSPNGSTEWKKEHSTKIAVKETAGTITEMKYVWTDSVQEPEEFTETCTNNSTITGKGYTGKYHLWIWYKTSENKTNVCGSEEFYFDNEGPTVNLTATPVSETSFTLTATASDTKSGIATYEFYIDEEKKEPTTVTDGTATYTWEGKEMAEKECYVIVSDKLGNPSKQIITGKTIMYAWEKWNCNEEKEYQEVLKNTNLNKRWVEPFNSILVYKKYSIDSNGFVTFQNSTSISLSSSGSWEGYYTPSPPHTSYSQTSDLKSIYKMKKCVVSFISMGSSQRQAYVYYDVYDVEEVTTYSKGDESLGYVTSLNPSQYEDNKRNEDGYWYIKVENR